MFIMLRILFISLSFVFSLSLVAQENAAPAFVSTSTIEFFDKESIKFDGYLNDLKTSSGY